MGCDVNFGVNPPALLLEKGSYLDFLEGFPKAVLFVKHYIPFDINDNQQTKVFFLTLECQGAYAV